jgi:hypothetical protein
MKRTVATVLAGLGIILAGAIQTAAHNRLKVEHARMTRGASFARSGIDSQLRLIRHSL